jgi:hypothetical protein
LRLREFLTGTPYHTLSRRSTLYLVEANGEASRGTTTKVRRTPSAASGWTTTKVAAKALGVSPRTVQSYIRRGSLDGRVEGAGVKRTWYVSVDSLNALRARRIAEDDGETFHDSSSAELAESLGEAMQNLSAKLAEEAAKAARLEARLEISEKTQSTVEEEARELREENERLRAELAARRPWWRRFFGFE